MIPNCKKSTLIRLKFVDAYVMTYGSIKTSNVMSVFGLSRVQVTRLLTLYRKIAPGNLVLLSRERGAGLINFKSSEYKPIKEFWGSDSLVPGAFLNAVGDVFGVNVARMGSRSQKDKQGA